MENILKRTGSYLSDKIVDAGAILMGGPIDLDKTSSTSNTRENNPVTQALDYSADRIKYYLYKRRDKEKK